MNLLHLDLTDSSSFKRARFWVKELQNCEEVNYTHVSQQQERLKIIQPFIDALFYFQHCKIYLCGTKSDLIEADRSVRQVDYHDVQDFADGKHAFS